MTPNQLLNIKTWTPLREVATGLEEILPRIFAIQQDIYFQTQPYNAQFQEGLAEAPFITALYWAGSLSALRRCLSGDASANVPPPPVPPAEFLLSTDGTYGELAARISPERRNVAETASYDREGKFLYKQISIPPFTYCYSALEITSKEQTCLIKVRLP